MSTKEFHRDNHYIPCLYLKCFANSNSKIQTYRTLVSNSKVPEWREHSSKGIAYHAHLYTAITAQGETDEFERWLDREFEAPAEEVIQKVKANAQLTPTDWHCLIRFAAALDVRTPARMLEDLERWKKDTPHLLKQVSESALQELKSLTKEQVSTNPSFNHESLPLRVKVEIEDGKTTGKITTEILLGRELWLFKLKHVLSTTVEALHRHRWTILSPPKGLSFFTTDNPVIRLNSQRKNLYNFQGGWNNPGSEIFLPLTPYHLLYTRVGQKPPQRGSTLTLDQGKLFRRIIAEHAFRFVFSHKKDLEVKKLRPRIVDSERFQKENDYLKSWHKQNVEAEQEIPRWQV